MSIYYEMTGSLRAAGFKTKAELIARLKVLGYVKDDLAGAGHGKLPEQVCNLLLTDSYDSKSGKMTKAKKLGIRILTYEDLLKELDEGDASDDDKSLENLRKFLESDDLAMRRMGLSMANGMEVPEELQYHLLAIQRFDPVEGNRKISGKLLENFEEVSDFTTYLSGNAIYLESELVLEHERFYPDWDYDEISAMRAALKDEFEEESEMIIVALHIFPEEAIDYLWKEMDILGGLYGRTTGFVFNSYLVEDIPKLIRNEKARKKWADTIAAFIHENFPNRGDYKNFSDEVEKYERVFVSLGEICDDSKMGRQLRDIHYYVLFEGMHAVPTEVYSDLPYTCIQIMIGWGKKESLIEQVVSYLTSIIEGGYEFHEYENIGMISQYTGLTEEELLEKIPWEEASNSLLNGGALENNYSIRPDWTVNTLKACHKNSKNKNDREYAKKALEELGVLPHEKPVESITDDDVQNFIRRL